MKAAIYTRFSSDRQRDASTDDQARNCHRRITAEGWTIAAHFKDEAVSGSTANRPGYQAMLRAAEAREFDVLIIDDLSRLSRDQVESERTIRRLEFSGLRLIAISDGYDSTSKARKIQRGVKGLMNEMFLDDLRDKTHRGLTGQALKQLSAGGRSYGYRPVRVMDATHSDAYGDPKVIGYRREIDAEQARVVLEIFQRYSSGDGLRTIAADLNSRSIPSPGATWNRRSRRKDGRWLASSVHTILRNEIYTGRYIWNRTRWERDPETRKRRCVERPPSEWIVHDLPELRIVPEDIWKRTTARISARSELFRSRTPKGTARGGQPKYLLSGLLECAVCGAKFIISGTKPARYVCGSHRNGGRHACMNYLSVSRNLVEEKLLEPVLQQLLSPEAVALATKDMQRISQERRQAAKAQPATAAQAAALDHQIEELQRLLKSGVLSPAVAGAALEKANHDRRVALETPADDGKEIERVVRLLPRAAEAYRVQVVKARSPVPHPRYVHSARLALRELFAGNVKLLPAPRRVSM